MSQVFISYSRANLSFVESRLVPTCRECGHEPWYDTGDIQAAEAWERSIVEALRQSSYLLLVMSPDAARSDWVKDELHLAIGEFGLNVIPIMLIDCRPLDFHIRLPRLQYIDYRQNTAAAREQLRRCLSDDQPTPPPTLDPDLTAEFIGLAASLLSRFELKHLKNLAQGRTQYTGQRSMRHEIKHLCDLGLLVRRTNRRIGDMRDDRSCDLAEFVEFTPTGKAMIARLIDA